MAPDLIEERHGADYKIIDAVEWKPIDGRTFECKMLICSETEGGFSAHALRLPGVVTEGETPDEAVEAMEDAFRAAVSVYLEESGNVPWCDNPVQRIGMCQERWILVNV